jgi:endonuclease YncB( thermonuclease family)
MKRLAPIAAALLSLLLYVVVFAQDIEGTVNKGANLRSGPGTTYAIVGKATQGQAVTITDKSAAGDWYQLDTGEWIAAFLVTLDAVPATPPAGSVVATVVKIVDGDTIDVVINKQTYRVRYILVNTPERGQDFYQEATNANSALVAGKTVYLLKDVNETDRYGRLLRYVYLADGTHVNRELVRLGFAALASFPPDIAKEAEIRAAQQEAVAAGSGLWADDTTDVVPVVPPTATPVVNQPAATPIVPTATPQSVAPTLTPLPAPTATTAPVQGNCDPSYPDVCIPPAPPDLNCGDVPQYSNFRVLPPDPHRFDGNKDGRGCENN